MIILKGKHISGGIEIGTLAFYKKNDRRIEKKHMEDIDREVKRFDMAKATAVRELQTLYEKAVKDAGEETAKIFEMHQMLLEDGTYLKSVTDIITNQEVNAEYAVATTADNFVKVFETMDDAYMQERAVDVRDVSERILNILCDTGAERFVTDDSVIVAADDLMPSEIVQLDKSKVLGFVTRYGSSNSHTAILARNMNMPALIGLGEELKEEYDGAIAIIDGIDGRIYIHPDEETIKKMKEKQKEEQVKKALLQDLKGKENVTMGGQKIDICANVGSMAEVELALQNDAGGIGLFRSEFLYLENADFPTEEQQFQVYKRIAEKMADKKVIIRTMDIGADKQVDYFHLDQEKNPALGYRAIRICLTQPEIFKTQLRAIFRASVYGQVAMMFPMITSVNEVQRIKRILEEVKVELEQGGISYKKNMEIGIMLETPAAIMMSRELAKEVDFFSVGTNDLTQYTLAMDRENPKLDEFYDAHHPAVLSMIQMAAENAHAEGKWIGICGELGADLEMTETFVKMGIDELSVSPSMILPVRKRVREMK